METAVLSQNKKQVIRQELNIEKWPLFTTSNYRKKSRGITREATLDNGDKITRKVTIGKTKQGEFGVLRLQDYKVFAALTKLWEDADRPQNGTVVFALHKLAELLGLAWSGRTHKELCGCLERLKTIPIIWEDAFYQKETDSTERLVTYFNILDDLMIFERRSGAKKGQQYFALSNFRLNNRIINNILHNYSKPLYLHVINKLKKDVSILLYRYIDLVMANKNVFERTTKALFRDLDLANYKYLSDRKRLLKPALEELKGAELTTGIINDAELKETVDGSDWKIVIKKGRKKISIEQKKEKKENNQEAILAVELFNNRFPEGKGTLQEAMAQQLMDKYSAEKVMLHISRIPNNGTVKNPAGLLRKSLENSWEMVPTVEEIKEQEREIQDEKEKVKREKERQEREKFLQQQEEEKRIDNIFESLTKDEQKFMKNEAKRLIIEQHIDNSPDRLNEFLLRDTMVMIKVREMLKKREELKTV